MQNPTRFLLLVTELVMWTRYACFVSCVETYCYPLVENNFHWHTRFNDCHLHPFTPYIYWHDSHSICKSIPQIIPSIFSFTVLIFQPLESLLHCSEYTTPDKNINIICSSYLCEKATLLEQGRTKQPMEAFSKPWWAEMITDKIWNQCPVFFLGTNQITSSKM